MSEDEIDTNLELLKQQINARKKLLGQKVQNKILFQFSSKGQKFSIDTLRLNLIQLINIQIEEEANSKGNIDITKLQLIHSAK